MKTGTIMPGAIKCKLGLVLGCAAGVVCPIVVWGGKARDSANKKKPLRIKAFLHIEDKREIGCRNRLLSRFPYSGSRQ